MIARPGGDQDVAADQDVRDKDATRVIGRRVIAALIDTLVTSLLFLIVALAVGERGVVNRYGYGDGYVTVVGGINVGLGYGAFWFCLGFVLLYFFVFEASCGQTPGKRMATLRVAQRDGTPARPSAIAIRTLLRLVDWLPLFNLVGFVSVLVTRRHQRVGDLLAKTVVIRHHQGP